MRPHLVLVILLVLTTTIFAQRREPGSSSSSSGNSGSYSPPASTSSSSSNSSSSSSSSSPSYTPSSSNSSSRSSDSGSSRSSDSGSRSSSSYSPPDRGSYTPPSRSSSPEPSSRGSSTGSSSSPSFHSGAQSNSSTSSGSNTRDSRNGTASSRKEQFTGTSPSQPSAGNPGRLDRYSMREGASSNIATGTEANRSVAVPTAAGAPSIDPHVQQRYANKESSLLQKQSRLDEERVRLYTKYKLAGKEGEFASKAAKLDEKRTKLLNDQQKLASNYRLDAERKKCIGKNCPAMCPPGSVPTHHGCVACPPANQPTYPTGRCDRGLRWDGIGCVQEASTLSNQWSGHGENCDGLFSQLMAHRQLLRDLESSAQSSCGANAASQECINLNQQVSAAKLRHRQMEEEYSRCLVHQ